MNQSLDWRHFVLYFVTVASYAFIGNDEHQCTRCGKRYTKKSSLNRHIRYTCRPNKLKFACPHCEKFFSRPDNLVKHILHVNHRMHKCLWYAFQWLFPISIIIFLVYNLIFIFLRLLLIFVNFTAINEVCVT